MLRPALLGSAAAIMEDSISPAMPAQMPEKTYTIKMMEETLRPVRRAALALMPTAWTNSPTDVFFWIRTTNSTMRAAMKMVVGRGLPGMVVPM